MPKINIEKHDSLFIPENKSTAKSGSFISAIVETQKKNESRYVPQESVPISKTPEVIKESREIIRDPVETNPNIYDLIIPDDMRAQGLNASIVKNNPKIFNELKTKYIAKKRQDDYDRKQLEARQKLELEKQLYEERTRRKELEYQQYVWYKTIQERNQAPQLVKPQSPPLYQSQSQPQVVRQQPTESRQIPQRSVAAPQPPERIQLSHPYYLRQPEYQSN